MREIKFRAWDKDRKCFLPVIVGNTDIKDDNCICPLTFCEVNGEKNWYHNETCEIMQYTGLHDKNGKEIYEGDIVKNHMTDGRINSEEKDYIFEVVWCSSEASFEYRTKADILGNPCCVASNQYRVEVIGNIYENPEVLEMEGENE